MVSRNLLLWCLAIVASIGLLVHAAGSPRLPSCTSKAAEALVKKTFNSHILSQILQIEMTALKGQKTNFADKDEAICTATAITNKGENEIGYMLYWQNSQKNTVGVSIIEANRELNFGTFSQSLRRRFQ